MQRILALSTFVLAVASLAGCGDDACDRAAYQCHTCDHPDDDTTLACAQVDTVHDNAKIPNDDQICEELEPLLAQRCSQP